MFETSPNSQATAMNVEFSLNNNKQKLVDLSGNIFRLIQTFDWSQISLVKSTLTHPEGPVIIYCLGGGEELASQLTDLYEYDFGK